METLSALPALSKIDPPCPYFGACGGCALQDYAYPDQLQLKTWRLRRLFAGINLLEDVSVEAAEDFWRYRNQAEFSFGESQGRVTLGFHAQGSFQRVVDLEDCLLLPQSAMAMLRELRGLAESSGFPVYHPRTHHGFFRCALVRCAPATGSLLLCLVTARRQASASWVEATARRLISRHPSLVSVYWAQSDQLSDAAVPEQLNLVAGEEWLEDAVGPFKIWLHPLSFVQAHRGQANRLYASVARLLEGSGSGQSAWDVYCGIGMLSLYLSRSFRKVYGIDSEAHHLHLAQLNAARNGIGNVRWIVGKAEEVLKDRRFWLSEGRPDAVVVDPPRPGLAIAVVSAILAARPQHLAYISCNPLALLRDLQVFSRSFPAYVVTHAQAFDLFPHTEHVETLVVLSREG